MVRYYGLYANAHRGKIKKARLSPLALRMVEEELRRLPSKGWAAMIRKFYEVDPMACPKCGGRMKLMQSEDYFDYLGITGSGSLSSFSRCGGFGCPDLIIGKFSVVIDITTQLTI